MQKSGFKGIFKNAITKIKECHLTARRLDSKDVNMLDDEIDFENEKLGETVEVPQTKMRSAIIQNEKKITPYQMKNEVSYKRIKIIKNDNVNSSKIITKNIGEKKILLKRKLSPLIRKINPITNQNLNKSDNFTWKHDLFTDIPTSNYKLFIRNLSNMVTQNDLHQILSEYGIISGINVNSLFKQIERDTAEVFFVRKDSAIRAAENANGLEIHGKRIKTTFYDEDVKRNNSRDTKNDIIIHINNSKKEPIWNRIKLANNKQCIEINFNFNMDLKLEDQTEKLIVQSFLLEKEYEDIRNESQKIEKQIKEIEDQTGNLRRDKNKFSDILNQLEIKKQKNLKKLQLMKKKNDTDIVLPDFQIDFQECVFINLI